jgi:lipoate-protein ligase B
MNISKNNSASDSRKRPTELLPQGTRNAQRVTRASNCKFQIPKSEIDAAELVAGRNPKSPDASREAWWCVDLDTIDYNDAWKLQTDIVAARNSKLMDEDILLIQEHPAVFTLGRRGGAENLLVSESFLKKSGIAVTQVERGGNITYHGPGQLVIYPIVDLEAAEISVTEFVNALEEIMLQTVAVWGIDAGRNGVNRGVWVGRRKLGSIGIALRKGVSFHGLALNVNLDLAPFAWIQPCGLQGVQMTSMQQELSAEVSMPDIRKAIKSKFESIFDIQLADRNGSDLRGALKSV